MGNFYQDHIEPRLVNCACASGAMRYERKQLVPHAIGQVLEVGFGSGHNLPYYDTSKVEKLFALEPEAKIRKLSEDRVSQSPLEIEFLDLPGEEIPLENNSIDTILITFTLCTIPDYEKALEGMARVLKPGGKMLFAEHGLAPDDGVAKWQNRLNGVWGKLAGGCHLNRNIPDIINHSDFHITEIDPHYARKTPKIAGYIYRGEAIIHA